MLVFFIVYDSVFTAHFQQPDIPFKNDRTITPERKILQDMGKIEGGGKSLLQKELLSVALTTVNQLKSAIAEGNLDAINKYKWNATPRLARAIWGIWASGFDLGGTHADSELPSKARFSSANNIVYFDREQKNVRRASIRNTPAERAIQQRVNRLAADVSGSEWERIRDHITDAVSPPPGQENPISREELLERINTELGSKAGRFANRAQTIARTELTFAYNAGRLDTYRRSGLVEFVRFGAIADERTCLQCSSLNGLIVRLDDAGEMARVIPPRHPACRCVISPVMNVGDYDPDDPDRKLENRSIVPAPPAWMMAGILAALLVGGIRLASRGRGVISGVGDIADTAIGVGTIAQVAQQIARDTGETAAPVTEPDQPKEPDGGAGEDIIPSKVVSTKPQVTIGEIDLNTATFEELRSLLPPRLLKVDQIKELIRYRDKFPLSDINDLYKIPKIGKKTGDALKSMAEGLNVVTDLNNVRSWQQLWASNAGLTKKQAQALFEEIRRNPLQSVEDLRSRSIQGVGQKTIDEVIKRGFITQQSVKQRQKQTQVQRVGVGDAATPTPETTSRPEALERGKRQQPPDEEPPTPEGGSPAPTPPRTPSPYSGGGVGKVEPAGTPRTTGQVPRQPDRSVEEAKQAIDPVRQQALSSLGKQLDYLDGQVSGLDASLLEEMSRKRLFGKSPNQVHEEVRGQVSEIRSQELGVRSQESGVRSQIDSLSQRTDRMQQVFDALLDPTAPNYFERVPQAISSAKAELRRVSSSTDKALSDIDKALSSLDKSTSSLDSAIRQASTKKIQQLEQGLEDINSSLNDWNRLASQLEDLEEGGSEYLSQLQQLRDKQLSIQDKLAQSRANTRSQYGSTLDDVGKLKEELQGLRSQLSSNQSRIQQLQQRLDNLPTTRQQLDSTVRAQYDNSVKVRQLQRQFTSDLQQFRRADRQVEQNLNQSAQNQLEFYNQYDQQFSSYEQSYSPLIDRRLQLLNDDLLALGNYPKGTVAWLLEFGDRWQFEPLPNDLALALRGVAPNEQLERVKALTREVQQQFARARQSIKLIRENSEFRYLEGGNRLSQQEALSRAEDNLKYWQQQQNNLISTQNAGSSNNRLNSLTKGQVSATPDDTLGLSRRIAQNLDEWEFQYQNLVDSRGTGGGLVPADPRLEQLRQAREAFLEEAGQSRINQSRIVNDALLEAQEIYERMRSDASRTPVFDLGGRATSGADVLSRVGELEQQLNRFKQLQAMDVQPAPVEPGNLPRIQELVQARDVRSEQLDTLVGQLDEARSQLTEAQQQGRGTKKLENNVAKLESQVETLQAQINERTQEIRDLRLPTGVYNRIQELSSQVDTVREAQSRLSQELSETVAELSTLQEQPIEGLSQAAERRRSRISSLSSKRDRLTQQIIRGNQQVNQLLIQIDQLRRSE
jgi:SPP1 gp7 family putative phage head morphogenesis protein